jgi:hypothetical protein
VRGCLCLHKGTCLSAKSIGTQVLDHSLRCPCHAVELESNTIELVCGLDDLEIDTINALVAFAAPVCNSPAMSRDRAARSITLDLTSVMLLHRSKRTVVGSAESTRAVAKQILDKNLEAGASLLHPDGWMLSCLDGGLGSMHDGIHVVF